MTPPKIKVPGKFMLSGEYAALLGGSSIMLPMPQVFLTISECNGSHNIYSSQVTERALRIKIPEIESYETGHGLPDITADSSLFYAPNGDKLGLGLSAAEAVAIVSLRFARAGFDIIEFRDKITEYALKAHLRAQGGIGSGADIYCCASGAPIIYQRVNDKPRLKILDKKDIPDIHMHLVYTGRDSNTRDAILAFESWSRVESARKNILLRKLLDLSGGLAITWQHFDIKSFYNLLDEYVFIMRDIAESAGINYWTKVHDELDSWARRYDGMAKPVGAGGGDMALLIGDLPVEQIEPRYSPCININRNFEASFLRLSS